MELVLHVADEDGRINLEGVVPPGTHYTATRNETSGVVRLVPVKVATTAVATKAADSDDVDPPLLQDAPWPLPGE